MTTLIIVFACFATLWAGIAVYWLLNDDCWKSFLSVTFCIMLIGIIAILDKVGA